VSLALFRAGLEQGGWFLSLGFLMWALQMATLCLWAEWSREHHNLLPLKRPSWTLWQIHGVACCTRPLSYSFSHEVAYWLHVALLRFLLDRNSAMNWVLFSGSRNQYPSLTVIQQIYTFGRRWRYTCRPWLSYSGNRYFRSDAGLTIAHKGMSDSEDWDPRHDRQSSGRSSTLMASGRASRTNIDNWTNVQVRRELLDPIDSLLPVVELAVVVVAA